MTTFNEYIDRVNNCFVDKRIKNKVQIFFLKES